MNRLLDVRGRLDGIPIVLRIASIASIFLGVVFPLIVLIPSSNLGLGGSELPLAHLWRTGVGFATFAVGLLMLVVGFGILRRARWSRFVLIILPALQILPFQLAHWMLSAPDPTPSYKEYFLSIGSWAVLSGGYLFGATSAREFFSGRKAAADGHLR